MKEGLTIQCRAQVLDKETGSVLLTPQNNNQGNQTGGQQHWSPFVLHTDRSALGFFEAGEVKINITPAMENAGAGYPGGQSTR